MVVLNDLNHCKGGRLRVSLIQDLFIETDIYNY